MTPAALLAELQGRGAALTVVGDRLRVEASERILTDEVISALTVCKAQIIRLLAGEPEACDHVVYDPELAEWYRENPHLTCARCFLAGAPLQSWLQ